MDPAQRLCFVGVHALVQSIFGNSPVAEDITIGLSDTRSYKTPIPHHLKHEGNLIRSLNLDAILDGLNEVPLIGDPNKMSKPTHSADFHSTNWYGRIFTFGPTQAAAFKLFWEAWEVGSPELGGTFVIENCGAKSTKLADVFRDHPAWGVLILPGATKGNFRLPDGPIGPQK